MAKSTCPIVGCSRPVKARGLCDSHYSTARKRGDFETTSLTTPIEVRFMDKVDQSHPGGCWVWMAAKDRDGYGRFGVAQKGVLAHRVSYEIFVGEIPEGLQLDHLCRNTSCVNPRHLDPVTPKVNTHRGFGISSLNARKTHCIHGHEFTPENTSYNKLGRACRACRRERDRKARAAKASTLPTLRAL